MVLKHLALCPIRGGLLPDNVAHTLLAILVRIENRLANFSIVTLTLDTRHSTLDARPADDSGLSRIFQPRLHPSVFLRKAFKSVS